jgi:hypothetical protein
MRASIAQEDEAPSGVLPLEQVIAAAEGLTPASIVLLVLPPASGRKGLASTAAKQKRLELQTTDGVVGQRVTSSPVGWPRGLAPWDGWCRSSVAPPRSPLLLGTGKEDGHDLPGSGLLHALGRRAAEERPRRSDPLRGSAVPLPTCAQAYGAQSRLGPSLGLGPI